MSITQLTPLSAKTSPLGLKNDPSKPCFCGSKLQSCEAKQASCEAKQASCLSKNASPVCPRRPRRGKSPRLTAETYCFRQYPPKDPP
ncbi:MAG: hypothetical protein [Microviridae sp.]|nr:MAG: hypothetical protein [Microviridae sp.]